MEDGREGRREVFIIMHGRSRRVGPSNEAVTLDVNWKLYWYLCFQKRFFEKVVDTHCALDETVARSLNRFLHDSSSYQLLA